ncbi:HPr(Ser) kinase/phosphatase [Mycoplasmopsis agalactiae]|uniref:HPr kinase/phosphorylase n=1 Tax=Mycoplasmopsis agalactiae TaxID=2110 RepID=D3VQ65_MYCAA|nr:HPr(Ser) kinase/phosphatase [Mycoplasmopsis agalactiae]KAB6718796.1 HPr kinase/phosphorylase [Mycoplasmopsis agalactiae]MCE6056092.1 HPr kinase/phosphorylase [Mycoplasmopsis agalactiae]MCE6061391.1 HPr kinase/phosphorylase [Mycoplasmopsis agalactiae]MCE6091234.1 HPr kinase/phosphorylase [Mycoplasmopsis agalactiae]CBH40327.1 HPr kinase/phosphorylase [Mycoplasmopsis agalactiae]
MSNKVINVSKIINKFEIKLVNADHDLKYRDINLPSIHRLGLEIAGIIDNKRYSENVICWGTKESLYFDTLSKQDFISLLKRILSVEPPLLILSKGVLANQYEVIENVCNEYKVPLYISDKSTSKITSTIGTYLSDFYSEETQVHACLVSIHGIGVLIVGQSGIGKSEATHELIQRGHLFIADDAVLVKHIGANYYGSSPYLTKDLLEVRGTGLISIMQLYGVKSVTRGTVISLCVELVDKADVNYDKLDRLGDREMFYNVLGGRIPKVQVPIKEGASVSSLIEAAVIAFKAKKEGFDALSLLASRSIELENETDKGGEYE